MPSAVRAHLNSAARSRPARPSRARSSGSREQPAERPGDRVHVERIDQQAGRPGDLPGGGAGRGDDGGALDHRLEHREPEALAEARVADDRRRRRTARRAPPWARSRCVGRCRPAGPPSRWSPPGPGPRRRGRGDSKASTSRARFLRGSTVPANRTNGRLRPCRRRTASTAWGGTGAALVAQGTTRTRSGSMPASSQSARVASDGHTTKAASPRTRARNRVNTDTPRGVKWPGSCRKWRSWTVATQGARDAEATWAVACTTSTGPVARSTTGRRSRCQAS